MHGEIEVLPNHLCSQVKVFIERITSQVERRVFDCLWQITVPEKCDLSLDMLVGNEVLDFDQEEDYVLDEILGRLIQVVVGVVLIWIHEVREAEVAEFRLGLIWQEKELDFGQPEEFIGVGEVLQVDLSKTLQVAAEEVGILLQVFT